MPVWVALLIAYAAGSIPSAYLAGRAAGVDLRTKGSGNLGATNVVRVLGLKVGLVVFLADVLKGALPVALLPGHTAPTLGFWLPTALGAAAILGHVRPVWLKFGKGGKGVATACGVFLALTPIPTLLALGVFIAVLAGSGYVSLGSLSAAAALPVFVAAQLGVSSPMVPVGALVAIFVFWTHRPNMGRLRRGEEHHFSRLGRLPVAAGLGIAAILIAAAAAWLAMGAGA